MYALYMSKVCLPCAVKKDEAADHTPPHAMTEAVLLCSLGSWLAPAAAAVAAVGAAYFGSDWLGFGEKGIRKGSWASELMSLAQRSGVGKEVVSSGQSIGASGLKLATAFTVGSAAHRLTKGLTSGSGKSQ